MPQRLTINAAVKHCTVGIGIWRWASNDQGVAPDVIMACCDKQAVIFAFHAYPWLIHRTDARDDVLRANDPK